MLTSHIDISPTLLDLLGVNRNKTLEQGLGLWDSGLKDRTTFFLGNWYFGADGFHENGEFKMYSEVLAASFANTKLTIRCIKFSRRRGRGLDDTR